MTLSRRRFLGAAPALALPLLGCRSSAPSALPAGATDARTVAAVIPGMRTRDGAGVSLLRTIGSQALPQLDPFLLLDEIKSERAGEYIKGFPSHPHRGFETVTYMVHGAMEHEDSVGNRGLLTSGAAQWMTAGRGIVHSEMPRQSEGLLWGFQLWVNLPRRLKMTKPRYQDIPPERIAEVSHAGARVRAVAGAIAGARGPVEGIVVAPTMLDVTLSTAPFQHELPVGHAAFAFVMEGTPRFGPDATPVERGSIAVFGPGPSVLASGEGRFLLLAAEPIGEPIAAGALRHEHGTGDRAGLGRLPLRAAHRGLIVEPVTLSPGRPTRRREPRPSRRGPLPRAGRLPGDTGGGHRRSSSPAGERGRLPRDSPRVAPALAGRPAPGAGGETAVPRRDGPPRALLHRPLRGTPRRA